MKKYLLLFFLAPLTAFGAVSATNLTTTGNNVDQTTYATASITPTANDLILACVTTKAATAPNSATATGNGLTWVEVGHIDTNGDGTGTERTTLLRGMGASPTTGAITFAFAGQTQTGGVWSVVDYSGIDTSGTNGSGAIVQSATNFNAGTVSNLTVTLSAFSDANNAAYGCFGIPINTAGQPITGFGFTGTGQFNNSAPNLALATEFLATSSTTPFMTSGSSLVPWTGIGVEVKQATSAGVQNVFRLVVQALLVLTGRLIIQ